MLRRYQGIGGSRYESTAELIDEMPRAFEAADAKTLQRLAHSTKSSSANLGAMGLSGLAKALEAWVKAGELAGAGKRIEALRAAFDSACRELKLTTSIVGI